MNGHRIADARAAAVVFLVFAFVQLPAFAMGKADSAGKSDILATSPWSAAFVMAANPKAKVMSLAPADLRHPPEYELRPSDAKLIEDCRYLVYAGYEVMAPRFSDGSLKIPGKLVKIDTVNGPEAQRKTILELGEIFGTQKEAAKSVAELEAKWDAWKSSVADAGLAGMPVVTHVFMAPAAQAMGLEVVGTYGPGPLQARTIAELAGKNPMMIIDNMHNDLGKPLAAALPGVPVASFINFPGAGGSRTLAELLDYNRAQFEKAFASR